MQRFDIDWDCSMIEDHPEGGYVLASEALAEIERLRTENAALKAQRWVPVGNEAILERKGIVVAAFDNEGSTIVAAADNGEVLRIDLPDNVRVCHLEYTDDDGNPI